MPNKKLKFKLGSDPEFSFLFQGKRVSASSLIEKALKGKTGFSHCGGGYKCIGGEMGWDGCSCTAEIRPDAADNIDDIVKNFKNILTSSYKHLSPFDMSVLSIHSPVGGHVHFQISKEMNENEAAKDILHKKVASFFLPILVSENKMNLRIRSQGGNYGSLTDYHGTNEFECNGKREYTYEFRTPSAEWLITEKICRATFAYLATIYNEILYRPENFKKYMFLVVRSKEQAIALHKLAVTEYIGITESIFNHMKKAVKTFELYQDYKEEIDYIFNPAKVVKDKEKAEYNIAIGWGLKSKTKKCSPNLKDLTNEDVFKKLSSKKNLDALNEASKLSYNDDFNVAAIADSLSKRIAAFEWDLKNSYFLFGLKKGVSTPIIFDMDLNVFSGQEEIKTVEDADAFKGLIERAYNKFGNRGAFKKTINPATMKLEERKVTFIGLPYDMRVKNDIKDYLKILRSLEEGVYQATAFTDLAKNRKNLINDVDLSESKKGKFYRYTMNVQEQPEEIDTDMSSQGVRIANENINSVLREEEDSIPLEEAN